MTRICEGVVTPQRLRCCLLRDARSSKDLLADLKRWAPVLDQIAEAPGGLAALTALLE